MPYHKQNPDFQREERSRFFHEVEHVFKRHRIYHYTYPYRESSDHRYRAEAFFPSDYHRSHGSENLWAPSTYEEVNPSHLGRGILSSYVMAPYLYNALDFTVIAISMINHADTAKLEPNETALLKRFVLTMARDLPDNLTPSYMARMAVHHFEADMEKLKHQEGRGSFWRDLLHRLCPGHDQDVNKRQ